MLDIELTPVPIDRFEAVIGSEPYRRFSRTMEEAARCFEGRTLWCVNSSAKGGGVAEMLTSLMGYLAGAGLEARWVVIEGDDDFFTITKRIHNRMHGEHGDRGPLGPEERERYERCLQSTANELAGRIDSQDVVVVHDPQPAGLIPAIRDTGATVIWRSHIGMDEPNELARDAWEFLRPFVSRADGCVFSRRAYAWPGLDPMAVIPPSIDAFSPKNRELDDAAVAGILGAAGVMGAEPSALPAFERADGSGGTVSGKARLIEDEPVPDSAPMVLQVSRWDRLKDHVGVMRGFADHVVDGGGAHLVLAGPRVDTVADDPEEGEALEEVTSAWHGLSAAVRSRVHVALIPVDDDEENSVVINALQRRASVVVQKSLGEGFGLTLAEAMWKARPVVASRVGGLQDQVVHGESGLLVDDPQDLEAFGRAVNELLEDRERAGRMGQAAHDRVRDEFLPTRHLARFAELVRTIAPDRRSAASSTPSSTSRS